MWSTAQVKPQEIITHKSKYQTDFPAHLKPPKQTKKQKKTKTKKQNQTKYTKQWYLRHWMSDNKRQ